MYVRNLKELNIRDNINVGGKAANLGELYSLKINIPMGFCITYNAYEDFIKENGINESIKHYLSENLNGKMSLEECSNCILESFLHGNIPIHIKIEIIREYRALGKKACVAVRSSANVEDRKEASFAGQQDTFLNISGDFNVFQHVKKCWASLWSPRAIDYRRKNNFDDHHIQMAVLIQKMISPDAAGVVFTCNPMNDQKGEVLVNSTYGLGEAVASGTVSPDTYVYDMNKKRIIYRQKGGKEYRFINSDNGIKKVLNNRKFKQTYSLNYLSVLRLVKVCKKIEGRFGCPQDIEWGIVNGKIYIVQSRPITNIR